MKKLLLVCCMAVGALTYLAYLIIIDREGIAEIQQVLTDFGVPPDKLRRWPFESRPNGRDTR